VAHESQEAEEKKPYSSVPGKSKHRKMPHVKSSDLRRKKEKRTPSPKMKSTTHVPPQQEKEKKDAVCRVTELPQKELKLGNGNRSYLNKKPTSVRGEKKRTPNKKKGSDK